MALTDKKKLFAAAIMAGKNQTRAAIDAGYSQNTAKNTGSKLMRDPDVLAYIEQVSSEVTRIATKASETVVNKTEAEIEGWQTDPRAILVRLMNSADPDMALNAAKALMPYVHGRIAPAGKKEDKAQAAKATASSGSKFGTLDNQLNSTRPS